jgi:hypothetical protein
MEEYTKDDVVEALLKIPNKSRHRALVDQRSYLVGILAYRFLMTEHAIANIIGFKRDKVNHNKRLALQFHKDKSYMQNVYVYAQIFPFDFSLVDTSPANTRRSKRIELDLDNKFYNKLKAIGNIKGHSDIRVTIKFFLEKSIKIWEE